MILNLSVHAQSQIGHGIAGLVHDPAGASVVGASIRIAGLGSRSGGQTTTDAEGRFVLATQESGEFRVSVSSPGFASSVRTVTVQPGQIVSLDIVLRVDLLQQSISVTDEVRGYHVPTATSATRTDTPLMEIPQSVQVVPRAVIE